MYSTVRARARAAVRASLDIVHHRFVDRFAEFDCLHPGEVEEGTLHASEKLCQRVGRQHGGTCMSQGTVQRRGYGQLWEHERPGGRNGCAACSTPLLAESAPGIKTRRRNQSPS